MRRANYKVCWLILIIPCLGSCWGAAGSLTAYPLGQWRAGVGAASPGKSCSQAPLLGRRGCFVRRSRRKWHRQPRHQPCCSRWQRRTLALRRPPFGRRSKVNDDNAAWIYQQLRWIQATLVHLRGHKRGISSSADPHAVEGQLQTAVTLSQAAAKVTDH